METSSTEICDALTFKMAEARVAREDVPNNRMLIVEKHKENNINDKNLKNNLTSHGKPSLRLGSPPPCKQASCKSQLARRHIGEPGCLFNIIVFRKHAIMSAKK